MLSLHRIRRHLDDAQPQRLWADLAKSGLAWPLPLRVRLESAPVAAWALALRRVCELTQGPTALTHQLTERLLHCQQPSGSWCNDAGQDDPLLTALAAAALRRRLLQPSTTPDATQQLIHAHAAALASLTAMQSPEDGLFGSPEIGAGSTSHSGDVGRTPRRVAEACYILFLIAEDAAALKALRILPLRDALDDAAPTFDPTLRDTHDMANLLLESQATPAASLTLNPALAA
ncbi:MAG: hypothetical protein AAF328_03330 [Planctomycetota bacterium]